MKVIPLYTKYIKRELERIIKENYLTIELCSLCIKV